MNERRGILGIRVPGVLLWILLGMQAALGPSALRAEPAPRPISLATSGPVEILAGTEVQFLDASIGDVTSWEWDFTYDGFLSLPDSTQQNPTWIFLHAGVWPVRLEVCNEAGCSAVVKEVTVVEPCDGVGDLLLPELGIPVLASLFEYEACQTITTDGSMTVDAGGKVTFRAGRSIALGDGFSVRNGASFRAVIDPALDKPSP